MSKKSKPYKCVYCGRRFKHPLPHDCKDGFRKRNLEFEANAGDVVVEQLNGVEVKPPSSLKQIHEELDKYLYEEVEKYLSTDTSIRPIGTSPLDTQVGGDHYKKYKIQPIEFAMANNLNACQTNILKYIMRYKDKDGKKDLEKARHYIDILIQTEYPNSNK